MDKKELHFDYGWRKPTFFNIDAKAFPIDFVFDAFQNEAVTLEQEKSFELFNKERSDFEQQALDSLKSYIKLNKITNPIISPTALQFNRKGEFALLCDCSWDEENGIAVLLYPKKEVVTQDDFL